MRQLLFFGAFWTIITMAANSKKRVALRFLDALFQNHCIPESGPRSD
jgi:hypothetical protein